MVLCTAFMVFKSQNLNWLYSLHNPYMLLPPHLDKNTSLFKKPNELHCRAVSPSIVQRRFTHWLLLPSTKGLTHGVSTPHTSCSRTHGHWARVCSVPCLVLRWKQKAGKTDKRERLCKVTGNSHRAGCYDNNRKNRSGQQAMNCA